MEKCPTTGMPFNFLSIFCRNTGTLECCRVLEISMNSGRQDIEIFQLLYLLLLFIQYISHLSHYPKWLWELCLRIPQLITDMYLGCSRNLYKLFLFHDNGWEWLKNKDIFHVPSNYVALQTATKDGFWTCSAETFCLWRPHLILIWCLFGHLTFFKRQT